MRTIFVTFFCLASFSLLRLIHTPSKLNWSSNLTHSPLIATKIGMPVSLVSDVWWFETADHMCWLVGLFFGAQFEMGQPSLGTANRLGHSLAADRTLLQTNVVWAKSRLRVTFLSWSRTALCGFSCVLQSFIGVIRKLFNSGVFDSFFRVFFARNIWTFDDKFLSKGLWNRLLDLWTFSSSNTN